MRAKELVPILAEIYGVPFETAFMIDRSLAECGLRAKGKGRSLPEMTRREALIFLLACMVTQKATRAGHEVLPWLKAEGWISDRDPDEPEELTEEDLTDEYLAQAPFAKNHYMRQILEHLSKNEGYRRGDFIQMKMVDFLLATCKILEAGYVSGEIFKFEIGLSHGGAVFSVNEEFSGGYSEARFHTEEGSKNFEAYETQISKTAVIHGDALRALVIRTGDAAPATEADD